ncbi:unnamed protein product [Rotaria socialis]|uniref:Uncharacterized protein n=1 Tax=Rotaria socialis TaxID=392032 RepID=A0A818ZH34_9BILA|nr:unnamed protein product [Rotaria socialis]CAF4594348.1 unnamed protein product [Rotaria socialis]
MALTCFPGALNPFCRQAICVSLCSDQLAVATSSTLLYIYTYSSQNLSFITKFSPHSKSLSCMLFHPTIPGLLATGGAPNSRVLLWAVEGKTVQKQATLNLQRRPNALIWLSDDELIIGDEHGNIYRWNRNEGKLNQFSNQFLSDKQNDDVQLFATANKQKYIMAIAYKSGCICICHVDLDKNHLNLLHKLSPDSVNAICCSIQFAHAESPLDRSTLFYISYGHGSIKVYDYTNGKALGQLLMVKQSKTATANDPRSKTYYPLAWMDANTLLTGNIDGHLIKIDIRHSSHMEKSQLNVTPPVSAGKPVFSVVIKDEKTLFTYAFNRKLCICDLSSLTLTQSLASIPGSVNTIQACPLQTSCIALGVDTGNIGILDLSSYGSPSLSFLWQSIPADVCRVAWHPIREGRIAYSTRLGHVALYDTLTGRSRVVYDWRYTQPGSPNALFWGPLIPSSTVDQTLAILYSVGDGKLHRWDSPDKSCLPTDLTSLVTESNISSIVTVAFSDDQKFMSAICSDSSLLIRSCPSLTLVHHHLINCSPTIVHYHPRYLLSSVDISSKQYWLAVNDKQNIRLINSLESNSCIINDLIGHRGDIECLAWSSSVDFLLASGSQDKTVRLWNVETCSPLKVYVEHSDSILSLIFSSGDTNVILSGSRDQSLHIWNIEEHAQSPDQPIVTNIIENDEETSSNSENKKRHNKPRPNRAEREKKRAAKITTTEANVEQADRLFSSTNNIINDLNSLAYRLLWPSETDRQVISDLSLLPDKESLIGRIKQQQFCSTNDLIYHFLYWSGEHVELLNLLCEGSIATSSNLFFWMAILNDSNEIQPLVDKTFHLIKDNHEQQILEFITMMIKLKQNQELLEYLINHDHVECSLLLAILFGCIDQIRDRLSVSAQTEDT